MGPRPDGRGTRRAQKWGRSTIWLQWGRDRMAAERCRACPGRRTTCSFNGAATGWPRNGSCAAWAGGPARRFNGAATGWPRNAPRPTSASTKSDCFNGAATGWPRNAASCTALWRRGSLQWGRDRMAAERHGSNPAPGTRHVASMGPRPDGRGTPNRSLLTLCVFHQLQWGRDRMAAERPAGAGRAAPAARFNGAATGWPRNAWYSSRGTACF